MRRNVTPLHTRPRRPAGPAVAVVVPCYNEADRLDPAAFLAALCAQPGLRLIFVDDGSTDATAAVLADLTAWAPGRAELLRLGRNHGKAEAVRQGLLYAAETGADLVGYWDADLATPLTAIDDFLRVLARFDDVQMVFGSRRPVLGHRVQRPWRRRLISRLSAALARLAIRLPLGDSQCGAKLMRNNAQLAAALRSPFTAGWLFDVELFARLAATTPRPDRAFYEYPLAEWHEVAGSHVAPGDVLLSGLAMLRLMVRTRMGQPARPAARHVPAQTAAPDPWRAAPQGRAA